MESFVAWNGLSYAGQPPENWYLATDKRWWPSQPDGPVPSQQWPIGEGPLDGTLTMAEDGLHCVIEREGVKDDRFIAFDSILRASRTSNSFGSEGLRIQTTSQTFEWSVGEGRDDLAHLINQQIGRLAGQPNDGAGSSNTEQDVLP